MAHRLPGWEIVDSARPRGVCSSIAGSGDFWRRTRISKLMVRRDMEQVWKHLQKAVSEDSRCLRHDASPRRHPTRHRDLVQISGTALLHVWVRMGKFATGPGGASAGGPC